MSDCKYPDHCWHEQRTVNLVRTDRCCYCGHDREVQIVHHKPPRPHGPYAPVDYWRRPVFYDDAC